MITIKTIRGFTLIELLVVLAIISLMTSLTFSWLNSARAKSRDSQRRSDMLAIQSALEMYYLDYGAYPIRPQWATYQSTACYTASGTDLSGPNGYIPDLAPTYIRVLPKDPKNSVGPCIGYLYKYDGANYAVLDYSEPESWPAESSKFYDNRRPTWAWKVCNDEYSSYCLAA